MNAPIELRSITFTLVAAIAILIGACNKPQNQAGTTTPNATVGAETNDIDVTTKVKTALLGDANLKNFDIKVVTLKGDVRLTGTVDNQAQIEHANALVRGIEGVHSIHDELSVKK